MPRKQKTGTSMRSRVQTSPARQKRAAAARRRQEQRWAARSGPVVIIKPAQK